VSRKKCPSNNKDKINGGKCANDIWKLREDMFVFIENVSV
jgi:hypothetical protein